MDKLAIIEPESTYHVFNRANGRERLFISDANYLYFLRNYKKRMSPFLDTLCYCLMPNHFHLLVVTKSEAEVMKHLGRDKDPNGAGNYSGLVSRQFGNFFNAYAKAFNKQQGRNGSLFARPFKRKRVLDEHYLIKLIHYIHFNPVRSGLVRTPDKWKYSSFSAIISNAPSMVKRSEVLRYYDDLENFLVVHNA